MTAMFKTASPVTKRSEMETKDMAVKLDFSDSTGEISGYASLFGEVDLGNDVVELGAYQKSLSRHADAGRKIKMLWQHDPEQPIGVWDEVREDGKGLFVKGRILREVEKGREAAALIEAGVIDGLSIGYRTISAQKRSDGARSLMELDLWEVSLVTFPMLPSAKVTAKQGVPKELLEKFRAGDRLTEREFEAVAKGLGLSNSQAERAARVHLKGQGEPDNAAPTAADFLKALSA